MTHIFHPDDKNSRADAVFAFHDPCADKTYAAEIARLSAAMFDGPRR